jgi:hypothetical protein
MTVNYAGGLARVDSERDTPQVMRWKGGETGPFVVITLVANNDRGHRNYTLIIDPAP